MAYPVIIITPPDCGQIDGVSTFCSALSEGLAQTGLFHVYIVTPSAEVQCLTRITDTCSEKLSYYRCPIPTGSLGVGQYIKELSCGIPCLILLNYWPSIFNIRSIHSHIPESSVVQIVHDLPWLTVFEGNPESFFKSYDSGFKEYQGYEKKFLKYSTYDTLISFMEADHVICLCEDTKKLVNQSYQIPLQKISLISNGLPDNCPDKDYREFLLNKDHKKLKILFVGRPTKSKGWDRVIELAAHFKSEGIDAEIICVGFIDLKNYIPEELTSHFVEIGVVSHHRLNDLYRQVDFVFIPTRHEQCSYVVIEAMMHGSEIVVFDSFGLRNMLDNECAYIMDSVTRFPLESLNKGIFARKRYLERFTAESMIDNYKKLFLRILLS